MANEICVSMLLIIPIDIDQFYYVNNVKLTCGKIKFLPIELFKLNLRSLSIHSNEVRIIPREIGNCINLRTLDISENMLTRLPKEIFNLRNLGDYYCSLNKNNYMETDYCVNIFSRLNTLRNQGYII